MSSFFRYDFYQTDSLLFVTILKRGLTQEHCTAECTADGCLTVRGAGETLLSIRLSHPVVPESLELKCLRSKVFLCVGTFFFFY